MLSEKVGFQYMGKMQIILVSMDRNTYTVTVSCFSFQCKMQFWMYLLKVIQYNIYASNLSIMKNIK